VTICTFYLSYILANASNVFLFVGGGGGEGFWTVIVPAWSLLCVGGCWGQRRPELVMHGVNVEDYVTVGQLLEAARRRG